MEIKYFKLLKYMHFFIKTSLPYIFLKKFLESFQKIDSYSYYNGAVQKIDRLESF
tara:strand:+ start:836 stop:1000 length:165 start_codon:yes stop_codon:yes gene_type:complete